MYILTQLNEGGTSYNMPGALNIEGELNKQRLEDAFKHLIERHEALRTSFKLVDGVPVQKILKTVDFSLEYIDGEKEGIKEIISDFVKPFDLTSPPLMRVCLVRLAENRHVLLFDTHHIISDGMSMNILMKELAALYNGESLPELKIHYKDYTMWQNKLVNTRTLKKQEEYWLESLSGELPVMNLPSDYPTHLCKTNAVASWKFNIGKSLTEKIKKVTVKTGTTLFMLLLSAYNILLSKYTGQEDIIVGTPVAGRNNIELQNIIGVFVNTLALRNFPKGNITFTEFLDSVKKNTIKALENQDYQFDDLVNKLKLKRDLEVNPIFNTMFSLRSSEGPDIEIDNLKISTFELGYGTARFPLVLEAWNTDEGIHFLFDYSAGAFNLDTIRRMSENLITILEEVTDNPEKKISDIEILTEGDKKRILYNYNMTAMEYPSEKTIHQMIEEQVEKAPDNIALLFEDTQVSYSDLNKKANKIAWFLKEKGIGAGSIVGIMLNRSVELMAAMLGVLKTGASYMPIDVYYPEERIRYMLMDSNATMLLTQKERCPGEIHAECEKVFIDDDNIIKANCENPPKVGNSDDPIYIIYTSGSTGRPKGVILTHKSVNNFIHAASEHISFSNKTMLCKTTVCFDIFITFRPINNQCFFLRETKGTYNS
jgi:hypothetical protein